MNHHDKTREELLAEILELQLENRNLKLACKKYTDGKPLPADHGKTEPNQAKEAISPSEEKFRSLYDHMNEGSALHTLVYNQEGEPEDYRIIEVNPSYETQLGISREAVINKTSKEAYGVDEPPFFEIYSRVAVTGKPEVFETYFAPLEKYFSISVYCPYQDSFATIFENITPRRKAEYANERTQKLLEDSQRIGKIGGWEFNIDTMELTWTKEMYHIHEVDYCFMPTVDQRANFYTPESLSEVDKAVQNAIEHGESYEVDSEIITAKGNRRFVKSIGIADPENRRIYGFFQDITDRKRMEDQLTSLNKTLEQRVADRTRELETINKELRFHINEIEQFTYIATHDLLEPLNNLTNFTNLIREEYAGKLDEDGNKSIDFIYNSAYRMRLLLKDLMDYSIVGKDRYKSNVDCNMIVGEVISDLSDAIKRSNARITVRDLPALHGHAAELKLLFQNLIDNAIKFQKQDAQPVIKISAENTGKEWKFVIEDNGIGIKEKDQDNIFIIFKRMVNRTEFEGTGIGLALCKKIIELHGGKIWVESKKEGGSIFLFTIPE